MSFIGLILKFKNNIVLSLKVILVITLIKCEYDLKLRYAESIHLKLSNQSLNTQDRSIPLNII